jgi:hypothetical protein
MTHKPSIMDEVNANPYSDFDADIHTNPKQLKHLLLLDLDGTVRETKSGQDFINSPDDQTLKIGVFDLIKRAHEIGWGIFGVTNQGGVRAGFKSLKDCIQEQFITLEKTRGFMLGIYFAIADDECWFVKLPPFPVSVLNWIPLWINTPWRYKVYDGEGHDPRWALGGFRKPNPGMLRLAIAQWLNFHHATDDLIDAADLVTTPDWQTCYGITTALFKMTGDRPEDRAAAAAAEVEFIELEDFYAGRF